MNEPLDPGALPSDPLPAGRGALLRAAREAAGVSREEVASRLRLSLRQVQALEDDEADALPPGPFVRGFVRNYARMLGRDPSDFEAPMAPAASVEAPALPSLTPPQPQRQVLLESGRASANRRWLVAALVFLALGVLGSWLRLEHLRSASELIARQAEPSLAQLGALVGGHKPATAPAGSPGPDGGTAAPPASGAAAAPVVVESAPAPVTLAVPPATPPGTAAVARGLEPPAANAPATHPAVAPDHAPVAAAPVSVTAGPAANGGAQGRRLALDFDADCWVEVRDENNQVLWSGLSKAGEHRDFEAHGPVRIVVGNAPATRLSWNGRPVDLAEFTRLTVARLTLDPASDTP